MSRQLNLALRPKRFSQLFGQGELVKLIRGLVKSGRKQSAWMLVGETGTGKTTTARILAMALNCTHQTEFGEPCDACYARKSSFAIHEINASDATGIDEIRSIASGADYTPPSGSKMKVYILDEAQFVSKQAQNLLLKYFEEAPISTTWIICTTDPSKIVRTLSARCKVIELRPLSMKEMERLVALGMRALKSNKPTPPLVEALWQEEVRSPRNILAAVESYVAGASARVAAEPFSADISSKAVGQSILHGDWATVKKEIAKATPEDLRALRAKISGYLRGCLLNELPGPRGDWMAASIDKLAWVDSCTDMTQGPATVSAMYYLCKKFRGEMVDEKEL
jgi:DNA polymerase III delta prime subunit